LRCLEMRHGQQNHQKDGHFVGNINIWIPELMEGEPVFDESSGLSK